MNIVLTLSKAETLKGAAVFYRSIVSHKYVYKQEIDDKYFDFYISYWKILEQQLIKHKLFHIRNEIKKRFDKFVRNKIAKTLRKGD